MEKHRPPSHMLKVPDYTLKVRNTHFSLKHTQCTLYIQWLLQIKALIALFVPKFQNSKIRQCIRHYLDLFDTNFAKNC